MQNFYSNLRLSYPVHLFVLLQYICVVKKIYLQVYIRYVKFDLFISTLYLQNTTFLFYSDLLMFIIIKTSPLSICPMFCPKSVNQIWYHRNICIQNQIFTFELMNFCDFLKKKKYFLYNKSKQWMNELIIKTYHL